jgi:hypothetical protein
MTGSWAQLINGLALIATFAGCRLVWGSYNSIKVYYDVWHALWSGPSAGYIAAAHAEAKLAGQERSVMAFARPAQPLPVWLALALVASNFTLNTLNWVWFFKMIAAVQKRFAPAAGTKEPLAAVGGAEADGASAANSTAAEAKPIVGDLKQRKAPEVLAHGLEMDVDGVA